MPNAPHWSSLRSDFPAAFALAAAALRRFIFGSSTARTTATMAGRIATISVPLSPTRSTAGVISTGASAKPTLPPTLNRLMPVPRRSPEA